MTKAHSAAVACQCSSRMAPGSSLIETPAMPLEIGNCLTVASLPKLLADHLAFRLFQREFERRQLLAGQQRVGDVVHEARIASAGLLIGGNHGRAGGGCGSGGGEKVAAWQARYGLFSLCRSWGRRRRDDG